MRSAYDLGKRQDDPNARKVYTFLSGLCIVQVGKQGKGMAVKAGASLEAHQESQERLKLSWSC